MAVQLPFVIGGGLSITLLLSEGCTTILFYRGRDVNYFTDVGRLCDYPVRSQTQYLLLHYCRAAAQLCRMMAGALSTYHFTDLRRLCNYPL